MEFHCIFEGIQANLSVQEIVDCSDIPSDQPRQTIDAFGYIRKQGVSEYSPYQRSAPLENACKSNGARRRESISQYHLVKPEDDVILMLAVASIGPTAVSIKVTENFFFYQKGVFYDPACNDGRRATNHAVLLVGYGTDENGGDFWIIKNSWGPRWGQQGFARMARNAVIDCEVTSAPIYPSSKR